VLFVLLIFLLLIKIAAPAGYVENSIVLRNLCSLNLSVHYYLKPLPYLALKLFSFISIRDHSNSLAPILATLCDSGLALSGFPLEIRELQVP